VLGVPDSSRHAGPGSELLGVTTTAALCSGILGIGTAAPYVWLGSWKRGSGVVDRCYIDPTIRLPAAAYSLYGWALTAQYRADASGVVVRAATLPDPRDEPQPPSPTACDTPPHRDGSVTRVVVPYMLGEKNNVVENNVFPHHCHCARLPCRVERTLCVEA
jgi:hypothetical protein